MKVKILGIFLSMIILLASCNDSDNLNDMGSPGSASVQFKLIDAPVAYDAVLIDVQGLEYKLDIDDEMESDDESEEGEEEDNEEENSDSRITDDDEGEDEDGQWMTVDIEPRVYDLLQLNNGAEALLAEAEVEAGDLNAVRVILGSDNKVVVDGDTLDLFVPSGSQSGLKIKINEDIDAGEEYELIIDFDASKSIVVTGNDKYILKPVIRVDLVEDEDEFGGISGVVFPLDLSSTVWAIDSDDDSVSTIPEEDGTFLIDMLEAGDYSVVTVPDEESDFENMTIDDVSVMEGTITELDSIKFE